MLSRDEVIRIERYEREQEMREKERDGAEPFIAELKKFMGSERRRYRNLRLGKVIEPGLATVEHFVKSWETRHS